METGFSFLPNNNVKEVKRRISDLKHEPLSEVPCGWIVTEQTHKYRMCKLKFQRTRGLKAIKAMPARQDEEVMRAKQLQIAKLRVELNLLRDQLDEALTGKNFLIAQQIKVQMVRLKEEQAMMEDQLSTAKATGAAPPASASTVDPTPGAATAAQLDLNGAGGRLIQSNVSGCNGVSLPN